MRSTLRALPVLVTLTAAVSARADDPAKLLQTARFIWPGADHFAVVCNYADSREAVESLAANAQGIRTLTVVDIHRPEDIGRALSVVIQHGPAFLVLLPKDPVVRDGSFAATQLISFLNGYNIPSAGTRRIALDQGATFVLGTETNDLPEDRQRGVITVTSQPQGQGGPRLIAPEIDVISLE